MHHPDVDNSLGSFLRARRALQLDDAGLAHLRQLATAPPPRRRRAHRPEKVRAGLARLVEGWTANPAVVIGRYRDVLAASELAVLLNEGFTPGRNLMRDVFLDPAAREIYPDWNAIAHSVVASVRSTAGTDLDDPRLTELVGELSLKSPRHEGWPRRSFAEPSGPRHRPAPPPDACPFRVHWH